jgi:diguanylate cyclase (GGDEF)-like protein
VDSPLDKNRMDDDNTGATDDGGGLMGLFRRQTDKLSRLHNRRVLEEAGEASELEITPLDADDPSDVITREESRDRYDELNLEDLSRANFSQGDIDTLKSLTDTKAIEIASGDVIDHIRKGAVGKSSEFSFSEVIFALIQIRLPEMEAKRDWKEILAHKYTMSEALGRNVGVHVATLDYYTNIKKRRLHPKIVDARDYADTASAAITDELTKAYNRRFFDEEFRRRFTRSRVAGVAFSLLMLDLDHFKVYNDRNGHIQGDLALIETVRILHTVCSWRDVVARYGGEEFTIMLHAQPLEQALRTADKIRKALFDYRFPNEQVLPGGRFSASIGVTSYRHDIQTPVEMIEEADVALYRAKAGGRNRVCAFLAPEDELAS